MCHPRRARSGRAIRHDSKVICASQRKWIARSDELDSIAWEFLESEFTGPTYAIWPIERRLEAYLLHRGLGTLADDGTVCGALLDRVMANIGPALQRGILDPPRCKKRP